MNPLCLGLELILLGARLCMGEPSFRAPDVVCPVIVERSAVWQRALRDERLAAAGSPRTDEALAEWLSLRDQARACRIAR
ncbi:MAG: hypothetical protein KF748_13595 [Xanthobacteraceae bacterium]|nr:hypothetical protein [Xanthobacteraceae bacterium]